MLECVVNLSEGTDSAVLDDLAAAAGAALLDLHADPHHHRSVLTLGGPATEEAARALARAAVGRLDLRGHEGVHPRLGVVDVVPFVPLDAGGTPLAEGTGLEPALRARHDFAAWAAAELALPCFLYGPERTLPEVRRRAFADLAPDVGPGRPHATAGACAVGARWALVAYNIWLDTTDLVVTRELARSVRRPGLRTLGLATGGHTQVSCNLVDPASLGPAEAYDAVAAEASRRGVGVLRAELVGLAPRAVVEAVAAGRRAELDLSVERTIEARLDAAG
ncbi:MAG: glutamate formiminotransferase [Acidobacteriota bacterium]|nr:glutamate formiminotransferase [Acidobacteriota bacterium]